MLKRVGRTGDFLGCSRFPKCRGTRSLPTGVMCPKDGGELAARRSKKRGKVFYGCENYPNCDFVAWDKPVRGTLPGVRIRGRRGEVHEGARRIPEVPQVRQRVGRRGEARGRGSGRGVAAKSKRR